MSDIGERIGGGTRSPRSVDIPAEPVPGINLVGLLEAESGLGEVARRIAAAIQSRELPLSAISHRGPEWRQLHPHGLALSDEAPYDTNLICLNPGHLPSFIADVGTAFFAKRYSIGIWFWETDRIRGDERHAARYLDELWVSSDYVREAIESDVDIPVYVMPVPMQPPIGPFSTRADLDLPDTFTFLFVFDFWSEERKNPRALVEAFMRAFAPGEGPTLVVKSIHGDSKARKLERLRAVAGERGDVVVRDGYVSASERDSYFAACDCYVSLHRSEGLGLTMAEAMALGKPVIATGYSGNLEFMDETNSYLVPYELVDIPSTWWAHGPGATWAAPDVAAAADLMRSVWTNQHGARVLGQRARDDLLERFSLERCANFVDNRMEDLRAHGAIASRTSGCDARPAITEATQTLAEDVGASLARHRRKTPTSLIRRFLRRVLWPYLAERQRADTAVLDAVTSLQRAIQALEQRVHQLESSQSKDRTGA